MKGRIYIAGAFTTVVRSKCGQLGQLDNDPHFWEDPPTWGICRPDIRETLNQNDYVFYVLPMKSELPQMIFGYLRIREIITHAEAYHRPRLHLKKMGNKNPNGNIIVDANGDYNRYDANLHRDRFDKIKMHYAIGYQNDSSRLSTRRIRDLAPTFLAALNRIFGCRERRVIDAVSRWGKVLSADQVLELLAWLNQ